MATVGISSAPALPSTGPAAPRPGTAALRPGTAALRPGSAAPRPGTAAPRPGTAAPRPGTSDGPESGTPQGGLPWYLWTSAIAVASVTFGAHWDVSWHRSIGRDSFWTPAHVAIYLCGVLAGISSAFLILKTTFSRRSDLRDHAVSVFGLRGPTGAFLQAWGGVAMIVSAPFDNWWHSAYGLDVKILSPPHVLLMIGVSAVCIGTMLLVLAAMNRADTVEGHSAGASEASAAGRNFSRLQWLLLLTGGCVIILQLFFRMELTSEAGQHRATCYRAVALGFPTAMAVLYRAIRHRWTGTVTVGMYTASLIGLILVLPLFPAEPKLGPVFFPVTHFVPPKFPLLLLVPAVLLDLLWQRTLRLDETAGHRQSNRSLWLVSLASGIVFVTSWFAVQWPFADFLMSSAADNRFFGSMYFAYAEPAWIPDRMRHFSSVDHGSALLLGLFIACAYAVVSTRAGLALGRWMAAVQR